MPGTFDVGADTGRVNHDCGTPLCHRSIGTQLLVAVNTVCILLASILLTVDYQHEVSRRIRQKHIALTEEAVALHAAVRGVQHHGLEAIQQYVDGVCERMETTHSPGHHIVVQFGDYVLQATSHHQASDELFESMQSAAAATDGRSQFGEQELLASTMRDDNLQIFISEFIDVDRREARSDALVRLGGLVVVSAVAALMVNLVLMRLVVRPVRRLVAIVEQVGEGKFNTQASEFRNRELSVLSTAINRMRDSLSADEQRRRRSADKARSIQRRLLPDREALPGCDVVAVYLPAEDVAGDFYDFHVLEDGSWLVCVADVTGHGVPAAMSAALLKAFLLDAAERFRDPVQIVERVNHRFEATALPGDFATLLLVHYSPESGCMSIVNAGHEPALLQRFDGSIEEISSTGFPVGIVIDSEWSAQTLTMNPLDRLLITTDGVTETADGDRSLFGRSRLNDILAATRQNKLQSVLTNLQEQLDTFRGEGPQLDDVTMLLLQFQTDVSCRQTDVRTAETLV